MGRARSIVLLTGNHLCHNPRAIKEATALARVGFEVEVLGGWFDASLKARDRDLLVGVPFRFSPVIDLTRSGPASRVQRLASRLRAKAGGLLFQVAGVSNRAQFGYAAAALFRAARLRKADLFIAHSEVGLLVARDLLDSGHRVGLDMEDWFSEDLAPEARKGRPIALLRALERDVLQQGVHSTCPSRAMSEALAVAYGCAPPTVIRNAFSWSDRKALDGVFKDRTGRQIPSIHWYSQTLGQGRGLEELLAALPLLRHTAELHLRGRPVAGFLNELMARISPEWRSRIVVHDVVPNEELLSRIAEHDIGFAGEQRTPPNKDLTISNKMLQYLQGGLAVVASNTAGQAEIAAIAPEAVRLYPSGDGVALAERIDELLANPEALRKAKAAALNAAEFQLCWETQTGTLTEAIRNAIAGTGGH